MAKTQKERNEQVARLLAKKRKAARDIGKLPLIENPKRREACRLNLRLWCETYQPEIFCLAWSDDHLAVIETMQRVVLEGGLFGMAMPRGSGKSKLCDAAAAWAALYGHRSFIVLIGATESKGKDRIEAFKDTLTNNALIVADFPEVCYPIAKLERSNNKARQQTYNGGQGYTQIEWRDKKVVLPTIKGSKASGTVITVSGITGNIRGLQVQVDGIAKRPDIVFVDDPQDRKSAKNPAQVEQRLKILNGDILGLAGPGKKIAAFCPCTVIEKDDLAERILNREKCPEWQGQRIKLMRSMPSNEKLWQDYAEIRSQGLQTTGSIKPATDFYIAHKADMDEGADPSWPARYFPDEASAVQSAMNLWLQDEPAFHAEYQNEPYVAQVDGMVELKPEVLATKITMNKKLIRGIVPHGTTHLTCYVDVQQEALYYNVLATQTNSKNEIIGAHAVEYGTYPDQKKAYYTLSEIKRGKNSLSALYPNLGLEDRIVRGLQDLTDGLCGRKWLLEDGGEPMPLGRVIVDSSNWTKIIKKTLRNSKYASMLLAAKGWGADANFRVPMDDWPAKTGMRRGSDWRYEVADNHITIGTNNWKTFVAARINTAQGLRGSLTFHQGKEAQHKMFFDHLAAEWGQPQDVYGRVVTIWKARPTRDNHLFDCLVGSFVAASERGALGVGHAPEKKKAVRKIRRVAECTW